MSDSAFVRLRAGLLALFSVLTIAACGGGGGSGGTITTPPPGPPPPPPPPPVTAPTVTTQQVFTQLPGAEIASPLAMMQAPNDTNRWFVVRKTGEIRQFNNDPNVMTTSLFLDVSGLADANFFESGLLGMAFHPDWPTTPEAFVSYTETGPDPISQPLRSIISRFTSTDGGVTLNAATEEILLVVPQDDSNHNGGDLHFHPTDGYLYVSFGDGGGAGDPFERGQDPNTLLGTIIRIDVDGTAPYEIPNDNPFLGNPTCPVGAGNAPCPEIFAYGFRNPWRFSFDSQTGELWTGDVGQGAWEEVDRVVSGGNYGWDEREGAHCFEPATGCDATLLDPVTEYENQGGASITGGYVYRGTALPELQGWYVFADFITGDFYAVEATSQPTVAPALIENLGFGPSAFAEDVDGEVYILNFNGNAIYQIVDAT